MSLQERIDYLSYVFELLQDTNSRLEKEQIVKDINPEVKEDFDYIIECLAGKHKFGYKYYKIAVPIVDLMMYSMTVKQLLSWLQEPRLKGDLTESNISHYVSHSNLYYDFLEPIVNRTLKLGIGESLIEKTAVSPMLAKKFEDQHLVDSDDIFVTEKLDGNRCIAQFVNDKWVFTSRNGKEMYVDFDMSLFDKSRIYDGEVMSRQQTLNSIKRTMETLDVDVKQEFNEASGLINRHTTNKDVVYNIFDIVDMNARYKQRREELNSYIPRLRTQESNVRILPVLQQRLDGITDRLDYITRTGGEGLMINIGSAYYQQKRTNDLLKLKKVQTMDLKVVDWEYGNGKYYYCVGYLTCEGKYKGNKISCRVGTGLSDEQREQWANNPELILGRIVEIAYFSLSQNGSTQGTKLYSLRFPRLKSVREDKTETSEY